MIRVHIDKRNKTQFCPATYDGAIISGTQPRKNMTTMGKIDNSGDNDKMSYRYIPSIT